MKHTIRAYRFAGPAVLGLLVFGGAARAQEPFTVGGFKEACAAAQKTKRIVLISFYTPSDESCKQMDRDTWHDARVRSWLSKKAVCRKFDAEKETALAARYKIRTYPAALLLKPDGKEIDRIVGYRDPKTFLKDAQQGLAGIDSIARAKAKLNAAGKTSPIARMEYGEALADKGRYAEAFMEFIWCLDKGMRRDNRFSAERNSILLSDIYSLRQVYPPALDALKTRRDAARIVLEKGSTHWEDVSDYTSYNEVLGQPEQTLALYNSLKSHGRPNASSLWNDACRILVEKRRYADVIAGPEDVLDEVRASLDFENKHLPKDNPSMLATLKQVDVEGQAGYYEAFVGLDKQAEADQIRDMLLAFDKSAATYSILVRHAVRAKRPETVQKLVAMAKNALSAADFAKVEAAAK